MLRFMIAIATAVLLSSCATYHAEPPSGAPRALISGKQKNCIFECRAGVFIRAVNGVEVSNMWKTNNYYISPGPTQIILAISDIGLFGVCMMVLNVVDGEEYEISHAIDGQTFVVTANDRSGSPASSCIAQMGPAPSGATYIPMVIPVN